MSKCAILVIVIQGRHWGIRAVYHRSVICRDLDLCRRLMLNLLIAAFALFAARASGFSLGPGCDVRIFADLNKEGLEAFANIALKRFHQQRLDKPSVVCHHRVPI